jgi:MAF protein
MKPHTKPEVRSKVEDDPETTIVLASASPRRYELLSLTGWSLRSLPVAVDETPRQGESAEELASRLALAKCDEAIKASNGRPGIILSADTIVVHRGELLGKPRDAEDARRMLGVLRAGEHRVVTAVTLVSESGARVQELCSTAVPMREYAPEEIEAYLASGSALDKAGAYGIQDAEFDPVDRARLDGCFANVMGMPLCHVVRAMAQLGQTGRRDIPAACQLHTKYRCSAYRGILGPS